MTERCPMATEGRSVLVLGGEGFIGRHAAAALRAQGARVVIGSRRARGHRETASGEYRVARFETLLTAAAWGPLLERIDVVLNCVGILRPVGRATYARVHHFAVGALAEACGLARKPLVHVSALGLDAPVRSGFLVSKRLGELAVMGSCADWRLVRPALLDGEGGYGADWIRRVARWPVHPLPRDATGALAPLDVRDLAGALAVLCLSAPRAGPEPDSRIFEVGGPEARTMAEHLVAMDPRERSATRHVAIPALIARLVSHACDLLHATPFSYGHLELLRRANVPRLNRIAELLGRPPRPVSGRRAERPNALSGTTVVPLEP